MSSPVLPSRTRCAALLLTAAIALPVSSRAQGRPGGEPLPTIEAKTAGMRKMDGFFPLYWDADQGTLWMEIPRFDTQVLHLSGLAAGLGSNDVGLDRGQVRGSEIVVFERVGRKVLMVQPNLRFRSSSANPSEVEAVTDAFAR